MADRRCRRREGNRQSNARQPNGDNELTGIHISDGDPTMRGVLGARIPQPFHRGFRVFFTQQHGDNTTWEVLPRTANDRYDGED